MNQINIKGSENRDFHRAYSTTNKNMNKYSLFYSAMDIRDYACLNILRFCGVTGLCPEKQLNFESHKGV